VDPFGVSVRWTVPAPSAAPWIPRDVAFAAGGELVWAGPAVSNPGVLLLSSTGAGAGAPLFEDMGLAGAVGPVLVRAGDGPDELFAAAQYELGAVRRTEVTCYDARTTAALGLGFEPSWIYDPGVPSVRPALLECAPDGSALVTAVHDGNGVVVDWISPATGMLESRTFVTGLGLSVLSISADGRRAAIVAGLDLWVIEKGGAVLHQEQLAASTNAVRLSADGRVLGVGGFGAVRILVEGSGGTFAPAGTLSGAANELPTRLALDADGGTAAIGWWNFTTGTSVRLEVWDVELGERLVHRIQSGGPGALQNFPQSVELSADGARAAFGLWGAGDAQPDALLVDVALDEDVLAIDLPGSVEAAVLDPSGTRLALAVKDAHANAFASTGAVMLVDSGERDLQLVAQATPGGKLSLAANRPGQQFTMFAIGTPGPPLALLGLGTTHLDVTRNVFYFGAPADSVGRAFRELNLPATPGVVSAVFAVQAIFIAPDFTELSRTAVQPVIL
jgi:hypothetical protein